MARETTRRNFLGLSAAGLSAAGLTAAGLTTSVAPVELLWSATGFTPERNGKSGGQQEKSGVSPEISMWVTSDDLRCAAVPKATWRQANLAETSGADQLRLSPGSRFQQILGFGGAFTDAACYTFNQLAPAAREKLFHELFHPSQMGLSMGRVCVGASDYSTKLYSYDDGEPDPELKRFSIDHDREYILPVLRQAMKINPDLFLFSSPWSPPGWMKFNNSMRGGSMRNSNFEVYAQYYLKFLQAYAAAGVPIQALTTQNELDTDQDGRMPACIWPQEYEIQFLRDHLGPLLEKNGVNAKIWLLDHNYNLWGRVLDCLQDEKLRNYVNAVAWHGYYGTADTVSKVHDAYPEVEMHWTEGGPDYTDPGYLNDWCKWGGTFSDILRNWCRSITAWNLALDEVGKPNIGPFPCGGVVSVDSKTKEITRSGQYWAFAHYSKLIRRGARRFDSQCGLTDLRHVAVENPDGQQVLVITNPGQARSIEVRLADLATTLSLAANSVTTLAWK